MADILRALRLGLVAIANADATLRARAGRTDELLVTWRSLRLDGALPVIAYTLTGTSQTGGNDDTRTGVVRFSVFAAGDGALQTVETIIERLEGINWSTALDAYGVDAACMRFTREYPGLDDEEPSGDRQGSRGIERGDLEMEFEITAAA